MKTIENNAPLISTITLAYNVGKYIDECLTSILNQTYQNIEIIVVINGKSQDNTEELVTEITKRDNRIKLVYNHKNSSIGEGRLLGMEAVSGEFFTFIDGDDYFVLTGINDLANTAVNHRGDVVVGSYQRVSMEGQLQGVAGMIDFEEMPPQEYLPPCFLYVDTLIHGKLYRTSLFRNNPIKVFQNNSLGEDKVLHLQFVAYSSKIVRCKPVVHYFRNNPYSITNKLSYTDFKDEVRNLSWFYDVLFKEKGFLSDRIFVESFKTHHLHMLYHCLFTGGLKVFRDFPAEVSDLLYGDYIKIASIRNYLKQWKLYIPILELYRFSKYVGAFVCFFLNKLRIIRKRIKIIMLKIKEKKSP